MGEPPVEGPAVVERDATIAREAKREREIGAPGRTETWGLIARTAVFTLAVAVVVALSTQNLGDVTWDMAVEQYATPLWVVMVLCASVGCIAGLMVRPRHDRVRDRIDR